MKKQQEEKLPIRWFNSQGVDFNTGGRIYEKGCKCFDDPDINIDWRLSKEIMITSEKDKIHPLLKDADILFDYKRNYYEINGW